MFEGKPVAMFRVFGEHPISKMKEILGHRNPHHPENEAKQNELLRAFYGKTRVDNAFFLSESVREAIVECENLMPEEDLE